MRYCTEQGCPIRITQWASGVDEVAHLCDVCPCANITSKRTSSDELIKISALFSQITKTHSRRPLVEEPERVVLPIQKPLKRLRRGFVQYCGDSIPDSYFTIMKFLIDEAINDVRRVS